MPHLSGTYIAPYRSCQLVRIYSTSIVSASKYGKWSTYCAVKSRRLVHRIRLSSIIAECVSFAALTAQNGSKMSQNSALSILKVVTFNRNASKLQEKLWYLTEPDHYISSHYCRSGGLVCLICKLKTDRAVIGGGRKTFNLRSTTMDLFGCIFIKVAAAIPD